MQLHRHQTAITAAGARVVVIGNGAPMFIAGLRETTKFPGPIYTDPSRAIYRALKLRRGLGTLLRPAVLLHGIRALRAGFRQSRTQGDPTQQGGILVVGRDGAVRYRHVSQVAGDHAPIAEVLAALG